MLSTVAEGSPLRDRLILVVGARRSGTNWIGRIIATHPQVAYLPSETFLFAHLDALTEHFQHASMGSLQVGTIYAERSTLIRALRSLCDSILVPTLERTDPRRERVLERTPDHARHLDLIAEIYPDAHVVHIIRDGRDVARSLGAMRWGPGSVGAGAQEWVDVVRRARSAGARMQHYQEVRYEGLLADPRHEVARLYSALGLPADASLVESAVTEAEVAFNHDPSMSLIAVEKRREALTPSDLAAAESIAGDLLTELGYSRSSDVVLGTRVPEPRARRPGAASVTAVARRMRARARRATTSLGRPARSEPATTATSTPTYSDTHWAQHTIDQFLGHVRSGRTDSAGELLDERVHVQVWSPGGQWAGRGAGFGVRLLDVLANDPVFMGTHVRSDVHPSVPAYTIVFVGEHGAGLELRTLVLNIRSRSIVRVAYYAPS